MRQKSVTPNGSSEQVVKNIRRATRKHYSAEDNIRIVLDGLCGEYSIAKLCRREGMAERCTTAGRGVPGSRQAEACWRYRQSCHHGEVKDLRREAGELKVVVPEFATDFALGGPGESRLNRPRPSAPSPLG